MTKEAEEEVQEIEEEVQIPFEDLSYEEQGKLTKYITFDEWRELFSLLKSLSTMVLELSSKVDEIEQKSSWVTNPTQLKGVINSNTNTPGEKNEE
tara:strand:+ start:351 stop:635 length:285 start_codon:yes stop_codon:yes gene_type:complete